MFTVFVGAVGSGKTYCMVKEGMKAFERGEMVWSNTPLDVSGWDASKGGQYRFFTEPIELLNPECHCATVLFDEIGAWANNREYELWPVALTIKIIEHRKDHLDFFATVQDDQLAEKNLRRFYNAVKFTHERRWPLVGWFWPKSVRQDLPCPFPNCTKGGCLTRGDKKGWFGRGTFYSVKDVHPQDTQNKYKHRSQGRERFCYDVKVAGAYASSIKTASAAGAYYKRLQGAKRPFNKRRNSAEE